MPCPSLSLSCLITAVCQLHSLKHLAERETQSVALPLLCTQAKSVALTLPCIQMIHDGKLWQFVC